MRVDSELWHVRFLHKWGGTLFFRRLFSVPGGCLQGLEELMGGRGWAGAVVGVVALGVQMD